MPKLKGRSISKEEAVADINSYLDFRDIAYEKINNMLTADTETRNNIPLNQYYNDDENSFFFNMELLKGLIKKGEELGANCIRIYYGAAVKPSNQASLQLFNEMKIKEGSSTLVLLPCFADIDPISQEIKKVVNVIADGDPGGQWPGGSSMPIGGRVDSTALDITLEQNITVTPISLII